jgi:hypothetical protein
VVFFGPFSISLFSRSLPIWRPSGWRATSRRVAGLEAAVAPGSRALSLHHFFWLNQPLQYRLVMVTVWRWREARRTTEAMRAPTVEGGQAFATAVTTTEARGGVVVEAKCATTVEQRPPSLTSRRNRRRRRSSLDGAPLLRQPNDDGHGSGCGDGFLPARQWQRREYRQGLDIGR